VQLYPECAQPDLVKWLIAHDIVPVGYSPVGRFGVKHKDAKFESVTHPYVVELAQKYGKTPV
jgi:diketogulonate reductase-like aldo/keto reductase